MGAVWLLFFCRKVLSEMVPVSTKYLPGDIYNRGYVIPVMLYVRVTESGERI